METAVLLVLVVCGAFVGRLFLYPSHPSKWWGYSGFGEEGREARDALAKGRAESRQIKENARRSVQDTKQRVEAEISPHQQRLLVLEKEKVELERLEPGEHMPPDLWPLQLYGHILLCLKKAEEASEGEEPQEPIEWALSMDGLTAWLERGQEYFYIRATNLDNEGKQYSARYRRTQSTYTEAEVDAFVERVNNRVVDDREFHNRRRKRAPLVAGEITETTALISEIRKEGDRKVEESKKREGEEKRRADGVLKLARDNWKKDARLRS